MNKSSSLGENNQKFLYSYLDKRIKNDTFSKLFEIPLDNEHFWILTHNNKQANRQNTKNPFYAEVSISRVKKSHYLTYK